LDIYTSDAGEIPKRTQTTIFQCSNSVKINNTLTGEYILSRVLIRAEVRAALHVI